MHTDRQNIQNIEKQGSIKAKTAKAFALLLILGVFVSVGSLWVAYRKSTALRRCNEAYARAERVKKAYSKKLHGEKLLSAEQVPTGQVTDPQTVTKLAEQILLKPPAIPACEAGSVNALKEQSARLEDSAKWFTSHNKALDSAVVKALTKYY
ncbi:hypothetical protein [Bifidobacterium xylocopae]|uniref:hypothetical protein n=1 Tax=Bifidobacterium xylocopae TaxID=2493119 RepID=UPI000FDDB5CF|nr:hypothetical protein [Bifidobacterium xylocopae]